AHGMFNVALAGGTTPKGAYSLLANDAAIRPQVHWDRVRFFWGDERHVPPDHPESNFRMAKEALLDTLAIDDRQVWRIRGECADANRAAVEYERDLIKAFALQPGDVPRFDLIVLGMGSDGHTASLFPGTPAVHERQR